MMLQDEGQNSIINGLSMPDIFEYTKAHVLWLPVLTAAVGIFFYFCNNNNNNKWLSNNNILTITQYFILFLAQFSTPVVSVHNHNLNIPQKTKVLLSASPLRISDFTSPLTISNLGFFHTTFVKLIPFRQNTTESCRCIYAQKQTSFVHESTDYSPSVVLSINASVPAKYDITHATQTRLVAGVENKPFYQYFTHTSFVSVRCTKDVKYSNISPSFTHTVYPQTFFPATKYNLCEYTDCYKGSNSYNSQVSRPFFPLFSSRLRKGRAINYNENDCCKENLRKLKYLHSYLHGYSSEFDYPSDRQNIHHFQQNAANSITPQNSRNAFDFSCLSFGDPSRHEISIDRYKASNQETKEQKIIKVSSIETKHIEFKTSQIISNPYLLTNVRSKYSVYCRLCETQLYRQRSMEQTHAIKPTFTNLDFPEPQTRTQDSDVSKRECCARYKISSEDSFTKNSYIIDNDVMSILPTLPPAIFPEPSTKYSVQSTEIPFIYSYEVTLDHSFYYSHTWTKEKLPKSVFPLLTSQATTLLSGLSSSLDTQRVQKSLHLESSIKSLPEVYMKSTEVHSAMTPHFSDSIG